MRSRPLPALREKNYGDCEGYSWQQLRDEYPEVFNQILDPTDRI